MPVALGQTGLFVVDWLLAAPHVGFYECRLMRHPNHAALETQICLRHAATLGVTVAEKQAEPAALHPGHQGPADTHLEKPGEKALENQRPLLPFQRLLVGLG